MVLFSIKSQSEYSQSSTSYSELPSSVDRCLNNKIAIIFRSFLFWQNLLRTRHPYCSCNTRYVCKLRILKDVESSTPSAKNFQRNLLTSSMFRREYCLKNFLSKSLSIKKDSGSPIRFCPSQWNLRIFSLKKISKN